MRINGIFFFFFFFLFSYLVIIYFLSFFSLISNVYCLFLNGRNFKRPSQFFHISLISSDLLFCIYFSIISIQDMRYSKNYIEFDENWRKSGICLFSGIIANFSCLLSNFCLFIMTYEKFLLIKSGIKFQTLSKLFVGNFLIISILSSLIISILPIFFFQVCHKFNKEKLRNKQSMLFLELLFKIFPLFFLTFNE